MPRAVEIWAESGAAVFPRKSPKTGVQNRKEGKERGKSVKEVTNVVLRKTD